MNPKPRAMRPGRCCAGVFGTAALVLLVGGVRPVQAELKFRHHFADRELSGSSWGQTAVADLDRDGRADFVTGRSRGEILWYRLETPDRWTRHKLGDQSPSDVGAAAFDVDGDGWIDLVTGGAWYRNTGKPRQERFERIVFDPDLGGVHDVVVADVDGDGRPDVLTMSDKNSLRWYGTAADPRQPWQRHDVGPAVHAGIGAGDLDGDGDLDVARSNLWFENADGRGTRWITHENIPFGNPNPPYPLATYCAVLDLDCDGDNDLVMTENEIKAGRIGWLENTDGRGGAWKLHELAGGDDAKRGAYHSLVVADFDADGDPDVFTCEMEGIPGDRPPRWFIWENLDGRGGQFAERVILDAKLGGHAALAADFDGDGDLDIVGKLWRPRPDNANGGRNHLDFLENLRITSEPAASADPPTARSARVSDPADFASLRPRTRVSIRGGRWHLNDRVTYPGTRAEGLLMNVRMVNAVFEDRHKPEFDPEANTDRFLACVPDYAAHGVRAFTICLQGGMPGYEGALNSAFNPDGSLREAYLRRVGRVIAACDRQGLAVILGCFYQRQDQVLADAEAVRRGLLNVVGWIRGSGFENVLLEIANEFDHAGFDHPILRTVEGEVELMRLVKQAAPELLVSTSGLGHGRYPDELARAADFLLIHFNGVKVEDIPLRIAALRKHGKPIVCNEDDKQGAEAARAAELCVANGASWGLMLNTLNQYFPLEFHGAADDPIVYGKLSELTSR